MLQAQPRSNKLFCESVHSRGVFPKARLSIYCGTTSWPEAKALLRLGEIRMRATPSEVRQILERVSEAISATIEEIRGYAREHPAFRDVGAKMIEEWEKGRRHSLGVAP